MTNDKRLKIGLDFHGVISARPRYFADFTKEALKRGHEIHIITGGPEAFIRQELTRLDIDYTQIFAIIDEYKGCAAVTTYQDGELHIDNDVWNEAKANYCRRHKIDLHIDDSDAYVKWFSTPYCRYQNGCCVTGSGQNIDFTAPAAEVLNVIENCLNFIS